jgi:hypothetical protein
MSTCRIPARRENRRDLDFDFLIQYSLRSTQFWSSDSDADTSAVFVKIELLCRLAERMGISGQSNGKSRWPAGVDMSSDFASYFSQLNL